MRASSLVLLAGSVFLLVVSTLKPRTAAAEDWIVYGARAEAMGGANTAAALGSHAGYWNPANLARDKSTKGGDVEVSFATVGLNLIVGGEPLLRVDGLWRPLDWLLNSTNYTLFTTWLTTPNTPEPQNFDHEITAGLAALANFAGLASKDITLMSNAHAGLDLQIGSFGLHIGASGWAGATPILDFTGLGLSSSGPEAFADGLDLNHGAGVPNPLSLSAGAQALAAELIAARPAMAGLTGIRNFVRAELLAYYVQISAAETDLGLDDPAVRQAMINVIVAPGQTFQGATALQNNNSLIRVRGAMLWEISAGYGHTLFDEDAVGLRIGGNFRLMFARAFQSDFLLRDTSNSTNTLRDTFADFIRLPSADRLSDEIGVSFDLAATLVLLNRRIRLSLVAKNFTEPKFQYPDGSSFFIPAQYRLGLAVAIFPEVLLAALDLDLNVNRPTTAIRERIRRFALGLELTPFGTGSLFGLALRAGINGNLEQSQHEWLLSGGLGLRLAIFQLDLTVGGTFDSFGLRLQGNRSRPWSQFGSSDPASLPRNVAVAITLSIGSSW